VESLKFGRPENITKMGISFFLAVCPSIKKSFASINISKILYSLKVSILYENAKNRYTQKPTRTMAG
jgi:hypothetical protein